MKNYKITVSYDGTRYKGWQVLKSTDATIQGKLQMVLSALAGHPVEVIGSGRTDAGVHDRFHSRYQAVEKTYRYRIRTSPVPNVFERKFLYQYGQTLDVDKMKKAAQALVGTHDFASFCGNRHMKKSTVRTIFSIDLVERDGEIEILYCGNGFLQNMVRILTGTLIEVGRGERAPESMPALLKAKERKQAGYTAPPQGLRLEKVTYETMDGRC